MHGYEATAILNVVEQRRLLFGIDTVDVRVDEQSICLCQYLGLQEFFDIIAVFEFDPDLSKWFSYGSIKIGRFVMPVVSKHENAYWILPKGRCHCRKQTEERAIKDSPKREYPGVLHDGFESRSVGYLAILHRIGCNKRVGRKLEIREAAEEQKKF